VDRTKNGNGERLCIVRDRLFVPCNKHSWASRDPTHTPCNVRMSCPASVFFILADIVGGRQAVKIRFAINVLRAHVLPLPALFFIFYLFCSLRYSASDNLFGELGPICQGEIVPSRAGSPSKYTCSGLWKGKVKFGAPHVVDLGQELEHSPDGVKRAYMVGHGADKEYVSLHLSCAARQRLDHIAKCLFWPTIYWSEWNDPLTGV
jgi:hypothetical protein